MIYVFWLKKCYYAFCQNEIDLTSISIELEHQCCNSFSAQKEICQSKNSESDFGINKYSRINSFLELLIR